MLWPRLQVSSRLFVVFGESEIICGFSPVQGIWYPKPYVVQGSTVLLKEYVVVVESLKNVQKQKKGEKMSKIIPPLRNNYC